MPKKIELGVSYILENGRIFTPVKFEKGARIMFNGKETVARKEGRYIDDEGNRIRKQFLTRAKPIPNKKP